MPGMRARLGHGFVERGGRSTAWPQASSSCRIASRIAGSSSRTSTSRAGRGAVRAATVAGRAATASARGSRTEKHDPRPGTDATSTSAPSSAAEPLTIARPSPSPCSPSRPARRPGRTPRRSAPAGRRRCRCRYRAPGSRRARRARGSRRARCRARCNAPRWRRGWRRCAPAPPGRSRPRAGSARRAGQPLRLRRPGEGVLHLRQHVLHRHRHQGHLHRARPPERETSSRPSSSRPRPSVAIC
jgi:hypothetical protein